MIHLQASMKVNPAKREEFLENVQELIKHSLQEEGNSNYQLFEDAFTPNTFMMIEEWKSEEAIQAHNKSAHFQSFVAFAQTGVLVAPLDVKTLQD
ncbi:putative quinol monooxygenase [Priestia megaterium]